MELKINHATQLVMAAAVCLNLLLFAVASPIPLGRRSIELEDLSASPMAGTKGKEQVPQLLLDIYKCWNNGGKNCLPYTDPEVNLVTTLLGKFEENPPQAVQSFNHDKELTDNVAITFNSSIFSHEVLHKAELRVYKNPPSQNIGSLEQLCDLSNLKIMLYSTQSQVNEDKDIVILESNLTLSINSLHKAEWLTFENVTRILATTASDSLLRLRLTMGGSCPNVSPSEFGISFDLSGYQPELIIFAKSEVEDSLPAKFLQEFRRKKRQAVVDSMADNSTETQSQKPSTISEYKAVKCQIHDFNVSFAEIEWDRHVIQPASYNARLCAGRCDWPLESIHNYTKHAYIQSILNLKNPGIVPTPCCAPTQLQSMPVIVRRSDDRFETRWWDGMIAQSCGCL